MALRSTSAFDAWVEREQPSEVARLTAATFIEAIGTEPWKAPSTPLIDLSDQPLSQLRHAILPVRGEAPIHIWYRHYYAADDVDLTAMTNR